LKERAVAGFHRLALFVCCRFCVVMRLIERKGHGFQRNGACTLGSVAGKAQELRERVKRFAIRIVRFVRTLPAAMEAQTIGRQLLRSGTGISSNYHAAGRARSRAEFVAKLGIVVEEADETEHWLDVLYQCGIACGPELHWLKDEAAQLRAIFRKSVVTARANHRQRPGF
jgi:four helix bundle protein